MSEIDMDKAQRDLAELYSPVTGWSLTDTQLAALTHIALGARDDPHGWCRWGYDPSRWPWTWSDYAPLVTMELVERRETYMDVLLRPTDAGQRVLREGWAA